MRASTLTIFVSVLAACGPSAEKSDPAIVVLNNANSTANSATTNNDAPNGVPNNQSSNNEPEAMCIATELAESSSPWSLPPSYGTRAFPTTASPQLACDGANQPGSATLDFDGDGVVDMLITQDCADAGVGTNHWRLHKGGTGGFAADSVRVDLPGGYSERAFFTTANSQMACEGANRPAFATLDMTGDGLPDLVLTQDCNDELLGTTKWRVYPGSGTGFGEPIDWSLPASYSERAFFTTASARRACEGANEPAFVTLDFTGDGLVDLMLTQECVDAAVGTRHWWLFEGNGQGFARESREVALPGGYSERAFFTTTSSQRACEGANEPSVATLDLTGDGFLDLVITQTCTDTAIGTNRWLVYPGDGAQFGAEQTWPLPTGYGERAIFTTTSSQRACEGANNPAVATLDLTGDGPPDLVVTQECVEAGVGTTYWKLFENVGDGFANDFSRFSLPPGYSERAFFSPWNPRRACEGANEPAISTLDMTGDGLLDLVITQVCSDEAVGTSRWWLFAAACM